MAEKQIPDDGLRKDVREAINRAWPGDLVEIGFDSEESYFWDVYPKLAAAMRKIKGAKLVHERKPQTERDWSHDSDEDENPPDEMDSTRSYHLFFVCPEGEEFHFESEIESYAEPAGRLRCPCLLRSRSLP